MGWVEIPNGTSSFYYNDEMNESTYVAPQDIIDQKLDEWMKKTATRQQVR